MSFRFSTTYAEFDDRNPQRWDTGHQGNAGDGTDITTQAVGALVKQTTYTWNYASNGTSHFVTYEIKNDRADGKAINNCFIGVVSDPDVGEAASDDLVGFDATRNLGYAFDSDFSESGFTGLPGFVGYDFLSSPLATHDIDRNGDGKIDTSVTVDYNGVAVRDILKGEPIGLHAFKIFGRQAGDPATEWERFMVMAGHNFREDSPQIYNPYDRTTTPTDQRFIQTTGPFTLAAGESVSMTVAILAAGAGASSATNIDISELQAVSDAAQTIFDANYKLPVPPPPPKLTARAADQKVYLSWDTGAETAPDQFYDLASDPNLSLFDPSYRQFDFEGYRVWKSLSGRPDDWEMLAEYDKSSVEPRKADVIMQSGSFAGELTYSQGLTEGYILAFGGTQLFTGHEYQIVIGPDTSINVYDVNLGGAEIAMVDTSEGEDYWFNHGDVPARWELFDNPNDLLSISVDSARVADGIANHYVPGSAMYVGGMLLIWGDTLSAAPAPYTSWRIVPSFEVPVGSDAGLAHAYIDEGLTNGVEYYYAVTAYDFQLNSPKSLESGKALSQAIVVPRSAAGGFASASVAVAATHESGFGTGTVALSVADPEALKSQTYKIGFKADDSWFVTTGSDTLIKDVTNQTGGEDYPIVDGVLVKVVGPALAVASETYEPAANQWMGPVLGTLLGADFAGSSATPADYVTVEVRFGASMVTVAPHYWRSDPAVQGGYTFQGAGTINAEFWDVTSNPPRRLAAAFVEWFDGGINDNVWHPDDTGVGGREYLFITAWDYVDDTDPQWAARYTGNGFGFIGTFPSLYAVWNNAISAGATFTDGDVWTITPTFVNTVNDVYSYTPAAKSAAAVDSLNDMSNILVVPNPWVVRNQLMPNDQNPIIQFTQIPPVCTIRIYTLAGELIDIIDHNTGTDSDTNPSSGTATWDLRNSDFQRITSGLYIFHVDAGSQGTHIGKFAVVR